MCCVFSDSGSVVVWTFDAVWFSLFPVFILWSFFLVVSHFLFLFSLWLGSVSIMCSSLIQAPPTLSHGLLWTYPCWCFLIFPCIFFFSLVLVLLLLLFFWICVLGCRAFCSWYFKFHLSPFISCLPLCPTVESYQSLNTQKGDLPYCCKLINLLRWWLLVLFCPSPH